VLALPASLTAARLRRAARADEIEGVTTTLQTHQAVELWTVTRRYGSGEHAVTALDDVSVRFAPASFTAVMGPSGSGKSTLLHCAAGLDRATSGRVLIDGVELTPLSERALTRLRRERVGFVFQSFNLVAALSAEQNVELPLRLAGRRAEPGQVRAALAEVGLGDRARHRPSELSGGQQQRVAFADEPTGALDNASSREVLRLLRTAVDRHAQTVVMVTHDPLAAAHADRVLFLADGAIVDELLAPTGAEQIAARMARLETR
jgi:putative ABC transport system ATP-binding protein